MLLTDRQKQVMRVIESLTETRGPTIREMQSRLGILSPNGVFCHLLALEKKGLVQRLEGFARSWILANRPEPDRMMTIWGEVE